MNLLKGFKVRSDENEQGPVLAELNDLSFSGANLSGEPNLQEILADPVVLSLMKRDNISLDDITALFDPASRFAA